MTNDMITIRNATASDFLAVAEIGRFTFYETWRNVNTEEDMQLYMGEAFNPEKIKKDLESSSNIFFLCYYKDELIGYTKLRTDRTHDEFKNEPAIEMERIYVKHQYHGLKAGKAMMDKSIELARQKNYKWLWLGVNQENFKAIDFYKKYGFIIFGTKSFKLGNAQDDDYLMKMVL
jgi:diamine N-acetyltransferase